MHIGQLRHRVTFQRATTTQGDTGEPVQTWANIKTCWARVEPIESKERFAGLRTQMDVDSRVTCRYMSDLSALDPDDRMTFNSNTYDIKSVVNVDNRNIKMEIFVRKHG